MSSPLSARFLNKAKSLKVEDSSLRILQRENLTEAQLSRMTESDLSRLGLKKTQIVAILKAARSARVGVLDIRTDVQPRGIAGSPSKRNRGDYLRNRVQSLNEVVLNMQKENELYREILNRAWGNQGRERVVNAFKLLFSLEKKQNNVDKKSNSGEQVQHASSLITAVKDLVTNLSTIPVNSHGRQQSGLRASATSYMTPVDRAQDMLSLCLQGAQRVAHGLSDEGAFNFGGEFSLFAALATGHFYAQKKAEAKKSDNRLEVNEEDFVRQLRTFLKDQSRINTLGRDFLSLFVTKYLILEMKEKKETKKFSDKESMKSCLAIAQMKSTESSFQRLISRLSKFLGTRVVIRSAEGLKEYGSNENRDCITISKSSFPNSNYSLLLFSNKPLQASSNAVSRYPVTPIASPNMGLTINEMASLHLPPTQANYNFPDFWDQNSDSLPGGSIIPSFEKPVLGRDRTRTKEKKTSVEDDRRGTSSPVLPAKLPALYARGSTGRRTSEHSTTSVVSTLVYPIFNLNMLSTSFV